MPQVPELEAVRHLYRTIRGERHWVMATDHPDGHESLVGLVVDTMGAEIAGEVSYGIFTPVINYPRRRKLPLSYVTFEKNPRIDAAIREYMFERSGQRPDGDILVLSRETAPVMDVLTKIATGKRVVIAVPVSN